mgnify:CR=1 FL=1|tara:strand:+ start:4067 stop:4426 length:360 start_codon:yes stop_codon:yes gene_type:complete
MSEQQKKEYWSIDDLIEMTDLVQEKEVEYREKLVKFQWCELAESEEPKMVMTGDDELTEEERNEKYMALGKQRTILMMEKADGKNPKGQSLVSAWDKLPSTLKYQVSNLIMGVVSNPNE